MDSTCAYQVGHPKAAGVEIGQDDMTPVLPAIASAVGSNDWVGTPYDDDGTKMTTTIMRLKEGIERFLITDINNPAAAANAQSSTFVMWDAWSAASSVHSVWGGAPDMGVVRFNHVPGGSNVLYMDGHVEFVKYGAKAPVRKGSDLFEWSVYSIWNDPPTNTFRNGEFYMNAAAGIG